MIKSLFVSLVLVIVLFPPTKALALSCIIPKGKEAIEQYPVILKGYKRQSDSKSFIFHVTKPYKGDFHAGDTVKIVKKLFNYGVKAKQETPQVFDDKKLQVIFLVSDENDELVLRDCTPGFYIKSVNDYPQNYWKQVETLRELELINVTNLKEKLDRAKTLHEELPNVYKYYLLYGETLEELMSYEDALEVYKLAMAVAYQSFIKDKNIPKEKIEEFMAYFEDPIKITEKRYFFQNTGVWIPMLAYGRTLYKMKNYKEAYAILKHVNEIAISSEAELLLEEVRKNI